MKHSQSSCFAIDHFSFESEVPWPLRSNVVSKVILGIYGLISMAVPLILLSAYRLHAAEIGITLESGCHGPEPFFGALTGILMCLFLRFG